MSLTCYVQAAESRKWIPGHVKHNGSIDIGDHCTHCGTDTSFGSGSFVNRVPSGWQRGVGAPDLDGYMCEDCLSMECDLCHEQVLDYSLGYPQAEGQVVCDNCAEARGWEQ